MKKKKFCDNFFVGLDGEKVLRIVGGWVERCGIAFWTSKLLNKI